MIKTDYVGPSRESVRSQTDTRATVPQLGRTPHSCPGVESVGQTDTRATVPCTLSYQIVLFWSLGVANRYRHSRGSHAASPPPSFLKQNVPHGKL